MKLLDRIKQIIADRLAAARALIAGSAYAPVEPTPAPAPVDPAPAPVVAP